MQLFKAAGSPEGYVFKHPRPLAAGGGVTGLQEQDREEQTTRDAATEKSFAAPKRAGPAAKDQSEGDKSE